ncbi:hypothetical protein C2W62_31235 [Candidatus Entotheonella serta]|nr:hypothetical protein C2W62_31235 [Candidatus Entotheonella serta]
MFAKMIKMMTRTRPERGAAIIPAHHPKLNALAYTQGQDIQVGPGQERLLAHEGWHVVQQMQGRVQITVRAQGASINNELALEREADVMSEKVHHASRTPKTTTCEFATRAFALPSIGNSQREHTRQDLIQCISHSHDICNPTVKDVIQRQIHDNVKDGTKVYDENGVMYIITVQDKT